ncbi:MAG: type II toxin-antitoxin system VapC family toxin [Propionibacteriaceae bacterium]|jgi:PIN domain nuclease of toxin-antitoxin system|nr:type II toxin-antitoxin system VapC family toxin [Propionibacteriaceae bacterium]
MRLLLDTNVLLFSLSDDPRLAPFRDALEDPANDVFFSAVSGVEISIKASLGKLAVPADYLAAVTDQGFAELPFTAAHAGLVRDLPWHHRDPFDRMIIAQALAEGLPVATTDGAFAAYGVTMLDR